MHRELLLDIEAFVKGVELCISEIVKAAMPRVAELLLRWSCGVRRGPVQLQYGGCRWPRNPRVYQEDHVRPVASKCRRTSTNGSICLLRIVKVP